MDSLLANYASSDDEEEEEKESKPSSYPSSLSKPSFLSSLPPPKFPNPPSSSSSSSSSLMPPPRSRQIEEIQPVESKQTRPLFSSLPPPSSSSSSSSLFPSMPPPKSRHVEESQTFDSKQKRPTFSSVHPPKSQPAPNPNPRKPVQFAIPLNPSLLKPSDSDDEDEEDVKDASDSPVVAPAPAGHIALTSILPTAKNFLAVAPTASSRRSAFDSSLHAPSKAETLGTRQESSSLDIYGSSKAESFEGGEQQQQHQQQESGNSEDYGSYPLEQEAGGYEDYASYDGSWAANGSADASYASSYQSGGYENYGSYVGSMSDGNAVAVALPVVPEMERIAGKRGRNAIPTEIVEVTQADLMKNRPREDQVKATGIAFGPAYQAVSSSKGKPSKLHKRKHQIGSLFFDMKQKEMELAERRSKGLLTKAETHAKYGW